MRPSESQHMEEMSGVIESISDQLSYFERKEAKQLWLALVSHIFCSKIWKLAQWQQEIHFVSFSEHVSFSEMLTMDVRNDLILKNPKQQDCPEREWDIGCFRLNAVKAQAAHRGWSYNRGSCVTGPGFSSTDMGKQNNRKRTSEYCYGSSCFDISTLVRAMI